MGIKEVLLYVSEAAVAGTGTGAVYKASDFLGAEATAATKTKFFFRRELGTNSSGNVELTHTTDGHLQIMEAMANLMSSAGGFKIVADEANGLFMQVPSRGATAISISEADVTI